MAITGAGKYFTAWASGTYDVATGSLTLKDLEDAYEKLRKEYFTTSVSGTYRTFATDVMQDPTLRWTQAFRNGNIGEPKRIIRSVPEKTPAKTPAPPVKAPEPEKVPAKVELEQ